MSVEDFVKHVNKSQGFGDRAKIHSFGNETASVSVEKGGPGSGVKGHEEHQQILAQRNFKPAGEVTLPSDEDASKRVPFSVYQRTDQGEEPGQKIVNSVLVHPNGKWQHFAEDPEDGNGPEEINAGENAGDLSSHLKRI